jgi:hypothetical protein
MYAKKRENGIWKSCCPVESFEEDDESRRCAGRSDECD